MPWEELAFWAVVIFGPLVLATVMIKVLE